jgi:hypothetical protein
MKIFNRFFAVTIMMFTALISCKDDSLQIVPEWETGVNTYATLKTGSSSGFVNGNGTTPVEVNFRWISIDGANTVNKIEFFILFNETYVDPDGNSKLVRHGGTEGKLIKTVEGSAVPGNRADVSISVTPAEVYNLYKDNTYNYCGTSVSVFNNSLKPTRTVSVPFIPGDSFILRWVVYTVDGRKFDSWSPSVCTEFPGSNCNFGWAINCPSDLGGTYSYVTTNIKEAGSPVAGTINGTGTLSVASAGSYRFTDFSFGVFDFVYGDNPALGTLTLSDACGFLSYKGTDQYGAAYGIYTLRVLSVTPTALTIDWSNNYGDGGRTVITRTDAKTWPNTLTTTPSGSCN